MRDIQGLGCEIITSNGQNKENKVKIVGIKVLTKGITSHTFCFQVLCMHDYGTRYFKQKLKLC